MNLNEPERSRSKIQINRKSNRVAISDSFGLLEEYQTSIDIDFITKDNNL